MSRWRVALVALTVLVAAAVVGAVLLQPSPGTGRRRVAIGDTSVLCDVADTPEEHSRGLQGYDGLPPGRGMLFRFGRGVEVREFEMKSVSFPVDVLFVGVLDGQARVTSVERMTPGMAGPVSSRVPVIAAIELPAGWAARSGVRVGDEVDVEVPGPSKYSD